MLIVDLKVAGTVPVPSALKRKYTMLIADLKVAGTVPVPSALERKTHNAHHRFK